MGALALKNYLEANGVEVHGIPVFENGVAEVPAAGKVMQFVARNERRLGDILGFSCTSEFLPQTLLLAQTAKRLTGKFILLGGVGATLLADEIIGKYHFVDAVCVGEGENTLLDLAVNGHDPAALSTIDGIVFRSPHGRVIRTRPRGRIGSLDVLPITHDELVLENAPLGYDRIVYFTTSRGCPGVCSFCAHRALWGNCRSVLSMDRLCQFLLEKGYQGERTLLAFQDDTFIYPEDRLRSLEKELEKRAMSVRWASFGRVTDIGKNTAHLLRSAGCDDIALGVDGHSKDVLTGMNKGYDIRRAKVAIESLLKRRIAVRVNLMWDWPGETYQDFERIVGFAYETLCLGATVGLSRLHVYLRTGVFSNIGKAMVVDDKALHSLGPSLGDSASFVHRDPLLFPNFFRHGYSPDWDRKLGLLQDAAFMFAGDRMRTTKRPIRWGDKAKYQV